jgi:hypothetical protein
MPQALRKEQAPRPVAMSARVRRGDFCRHKRFVGGGGLWVRVGEEHRAGWSANRQSLFVEVFV